MPPTIAPTGVLVVEASDTGSGVDGGVSMGWLVLDDGAAGESEIEVVEAVEDAELEASVLALLDEPLAVGIPVEVLLIISSTAWKLNETGYNFELDTVSQWPDAYRWCPGGHLSGPRRNTFRRSWKSGVRQSFIAAGRTYEGWNSRQTDIWVYMMNRLTQKEQDRNFRGYDRSPICSGG